MTFLMLKKSRTDPGARSGDIFDVTRKAEVYGPGRSYHIFAGKDGSRGLGMSSLKAEHAVSDYSTLTDSEMKVLDEWHTFFSCVLEVFSLGDWTDVHAENGTASLGSLSCPNLSPRNSPRQRQTYKFG